jgi:transposase
MSGLPTNRKCRRLDAIPGIGPLTATALIAAIGGPGPLRRGSKT